MRIVAFIVAALILAGAAYAILQPRTEPLAPAPVVQDDQRTRVIGYSVERRPITAHRFGTGDTHIVFVGGMHGGYEWNSVLLAYEALEYFNALKLPDNISVSVIPNMNPDAVYSVVKKEGTFSRADIPAGSHESARFNARGVDLNRNFDCKWKPTSMWRGRIVSAGSAPFSEPESRALRDFVVSERPDAVVFWHSQADAVYASECTDGILPQTLTLMRSYAHAAKYAAVETFDAYEISGDAEGWLATLGIPAITVELSSHEAIEWERNRAGISAVLADFATAK